MVKKRKLLIFILCALILLSAVWFAYTSVYYRADQDALTAMRSDSSVTVSSEDYGYFFDGPGAENALIFYPGGKVEELAYAPLSRRLSEEGMDVFLLKVPFRLAILNIDQADEVIHSYDYEHWYIGGHSLGGVCSGYYARSRSDILDGIVFLASYPAKPLPKDLKTVMIRGSMDRVLNIEKYEQNRDNAGEDCTEYVIEGGNHAQFGSYGPQSGDGEASVSEQQQTEETVQQILTAFGIIE